MASRKDKKGRVLRKGESFRITDEMYVYAYTDPFGKRRYIYSKDLVKLREKEEKLKRDQMDGIDSYVAGNADLNFLFDRYMSIKTDTLGMNLGKRKSEKLSLVIFFSFIII